MTSIGTVLMKDIKMTNILILGDNRTNLITPIIDSLKSMGFSVDYIDASELDKAKKYPSLWHKLTAKLFYNNLHKGKRHWGREAVIDSTKDHYDHIIVLVPAMLNEVIGKKLRKKTRHLVTILWDSLKKVSAGNILFEYSDSIFSFDPEDCSSENIQYLPSYHTEPVEYNVVVDKDIFGVFSINNKNDYRYKKLIEIAKNNINITGEIIFVSKRLEKEKFKIGKINITIQNEKIDGENLENKILSSKAIIDIVDCRQKGLSFRLGDAYKYRKLLITDNISINHESWFSGNFYVLENDSIPESFPKNKFNYVNSPYSVKNWIANVLSLNNKF